MPREWFPRSKDGNICYDQLLSNQNQIYCQVGLHIQGICLGMLVYYSKHSK